MTYDDAHCRCPQCGSTEVDREHGTSVHVVGTEFRDLNWARCCDCKWFGVVHAMVGKRLLTPKKSCPMAIKSPVEIAMAHDVLLSIHNGNAPVTVEGENKTIIAAQCDALAWVLGEKCGFGEMLENLKAQCSEAGMEFVPRAEAN